MKYILATIFLAFALTSCDPQRLTGFVDDKKEDVYDNDDRSDDSGEISIDRLPANIIEFINTNYPDREITEAFLEWGIFIVELDDGTVLYFDSNGNLEDISNGGPRDSDKD